MGDVAILMKSHFSAKETILSNGFVNCISIVGVVLGLYTRSLTEGAKQYILVFVAGNFIYIAADIWNNLFRSRKWTNNLLEIVGLVLGVLVTFGHSH